jgi:hypothetical protein
MRDFSPPVDRNGSKAVRLRASKCFPLCPRKRTSARARRHVREVPYAAVSNRSKAALYSITSSARSRIEIGTSMPRALAVLKLITSSNFVGSSTGKSAGFIPRSTFPAIPPNCR